MSAESAVLARLARLRAELDIDLGALDARALEVAELLDGGAADGARGRAELALVAVNLHGWYTALETALERVARALDDHVPAGATWHADLMSQSAVELPGVRPAAIPGGALAALHALRRFRHFFRNAYAIDLDPALVREQAELLTATHGPVRASLGALRAHLDEAIDDVRAG